MDNSNISVRTLLQYPPAPSSEPTSTVVLTLNSRQFIDLRFAKAQSPASTPNASPPVLKDLSWGFAGHQTISTLGDEAIPGSYESTWHHWVSSTTKNPQSEQDVGLMLPPNADGVVLEKGSSTDPVTGESRKYVEGWKDVDLKATNDRGEKLSFLFRAEDSAKEVRGVVIVLGGYMQALLREGDRVAAERWERGTRGHWQRVAQTGDLHLPCEDVIKVLQSGGTFKKDRELEGSGVEWMCEEAVVLGL
ncbi:hypothetical protein B0A48_06757 [Cryoendolithus antarcticus]|uniref:Protein HRI1 n=1 Tax=Cryoendolithus antarcticus TaxID=1507870 RepID=A0A1V8T992_9PEZI|nr:hypothetical protein B0A48_06757 [Cryoendolithus antarcticus]